MKFLSSIFPSENDTVLKNIATEVTSVNTLENEIKALSDVDFPDETKKLQSKLSAGESLDDILPRAYALCREAALRTLGQRHYDVQIIGGIALHRGYIAEMRTGEGKTLVATLPVYLNALSGKGVHIVTVNDYLARRDAQWMGQIYAFLGLSIGVLNDNFQSYLYDSGHQDADHDRDEQGSFKVFYEFLKPCTRREAYMADITYGTNSQFGFDYLRDHTVTSSDDTVQRGHHFALVDEIDSVLIDEARVPLILSGAAMDASETYKTMNSIANRMQPETHYTVDEKQHSVHINNDGISLAEKSLSIDNLYTGENISLVHHLETAVRAKALFLRDRDYVVRNNEILIVDQFTGRMQEGRRYSEGLHQAIEAKENVPIQAESRTRASITYQHYFRFYKKLSGMTGTAFTSAEEFQKVYGLSVISIPTNVPIARIDNKDLIFQTERGKFMAIAERVKDLHSRGQPVLIGTTSVEKSEALSDFLKKEGVPHDVLNAKRHEQEGEIIAQSGRPSAVTIATNMAGRGVDIKLGGIPSSPDAESSVRNSGGLFVIGSERHDARRIDDQLRGRSGRQGDPGETQFYLSLEDPLVRVFGGDKVKSMVGTFNLPEDEPLPNPLVSKSVEQAQTKIEGLHFDERKRILDFDSVIATQRRSFYDRRQKILFDVDGELENFISKLSSDTPELSQRIEDHRLLAGDETWNNLKKAIVLQIMDNLWTEHIDTMGQALRSVSLRGYGQRDPVVEYKKEGLKLFQELQERIQSELTNIFMNLDVNAILKKNSLSSTKTESIDHPKKDDEHVRIKKNHQVKNVRKKKLQSYIDTGWEIF